MQILYSRQLNRICKMKLHTATGTVQNHAKGTGRLENAAKQCASDD